MSTSAICQAAEKREWVSVSGWWRGKNNVVLVFQHHIPLVLNTLASFTTSLTSPTCERIHHFPNLVYLCFFFFFLRESLAWISLDFMTHLGHAWGTVRREIFSRFSCWGKTWTQHFLLHVVMVLAFESSSDEVCNSNLSELKFVVLSVLVQWAGNCCILFLLK